MSIFSVLNVKEIDNKVAKRIKAISAVFAKDNGFKMGKVSAFFEALAVNTVNSTSLGRWVKDVYNKAEDKTNDLKTEIKHWFKTGGGRYISDVVGSVLNFTVAAVVIATIEAANLISNARNTKKALEKNKDDPAWAYRYGKTDTLSDSLRLEGHDKAANIVGITYAAASCVLIVDGIYNLGKMVISKSSSIKAFITNKKDTFKIFRYNKGIGKQVVNGTGEPGLKLSDKVRGLKNDGKIREALDMHYEDLIRNKVGGESRVLQGREFDAVTDTKLIQAKRSYSAIDKPKNFLSKSTRKQIKETARIADEMGLKPEYWFKYGVHPDVRQYIESKGIKVITGLGD